MRYLTVLLAAAHLAGCSGIQEKGACDLAMRSVTEFVRAQSDLHHAHYGGCSDFESTTDEGRASIKVHMAWRQGGRRHESARNVILRRTDQGWRVSANGF